MTTNPTPTRANMPEGRVVHESSPREMSFDSETDFQAWLAEPLWRRLLGMTARDRRRAALSRKTR